MSSGNDSFAGFGDGADGKPVFLAPVFFREASAIAFLEACRWPDGYICPRCGSQTKIYSLNSRQIGLKKCGACNRTFNVKTGTIFEDSRIPIFKWFQLIYLVVFSHQHVGIVEISYTVGIAYKTSWRINRLIKENIDLHVSIDDADDATSDEGPARAINIAEILGNPTLKNEKLNINFVLRASEFELQAKFDDFRDVILKLLEIEPYRPDN